MNIIVAVDSEWGIGYKGDLLAPGKGRPSELCTSYHREDSNSWF